MRLVTEPGSVSYPMATLGLMAGAGAIAFWIGHNNTDPIARVTQRA